jgi:hypothetical protein
MLKTLTKAGEASFEVGLVYRGEVRISIATEATIQLGARLGSYKVPLVLAVVVKEVEGNLLVRIKEPPSSRLWYGVSLDLFPSQSPPPNMRLIDVRLSPIVHKGAKDDNRAWSMYAIEVLERRTDRPYSTPGSRTGRQRSPGKSS